MFLTVLVIGKSEYNITLTISVAAIIEHDMEAIWDFETFIEEQANSTRFPNVKNIYFEVNTVSLW